MMTSEKLAAIRARNNDRRAVRWEEEWAPLDKGCMAEVIRPAMADIDALLAEIDRLQKENDEPYAPF